MAEHEKKKNSYTKKETSDKCFIGFNIYPYLKVREMVELCHTNSRTFHIIFNDLVCI